MPAPLSASVSNFESTYDACTVRPEEYRCENFTCIEWYVEWPMRSPWPLMVSTVEYCGNGRSDCATVDPVPHSWLNPDQGGTTPAALAATEPTCEFSRVRPEAVNGLRLAGRLR